MLLEINRTPSITDDKIKETVEKKKPNFRIIRATNIVWSKKNLGLTLIKTLIEEANNENSTMEKIDSLDSLDNILRYIQPLLGDRKDSVEEEESTYEYEQSITSKLVYIIKSNNPEIIYKILNDFKNIFSHGGPKRRKYTLPPLAYRIIQFCHDISICYENKLGLIEEKKKNRIIRYK